MNKIILLTLLIISSFCFSQENKLSEFQKELIQVKNVDSLKIFKNEISKIHKLINPIDTIITINKTTKWKLLCCSENGWNEIVGQPRTIIDYKFTLKNNKIKTTEEVFDIFGSKYNDTLIHKQYPLVYNRVDIFNRKTIPILINNQFLTFRFVHSYPNGNQTSWFYEKTYYFVKIED